MPRIRYTDINFHRKSLRVIGQANEIIESYAAQGFDLTLRQLYYQFVSRDLIPNRQSEYKKLGSIVNDARLAGYIDWNSIVDRTRGLESLSHWEHPSEIVLGSAQQFKVDYWKGQTYRPEVWIEKDALSGVIEGICTELDVPYFSCRGYNSQSEMWRASQRILGYEREGQQPVIFHFGDHDPSGIDMTRDIGDRLDLFMGGVEVNRLALNMDQVDQYNPPPNFAKITDSRAGDYIRRFGTDSWELDALEPSVLVDLIRSEVIAIIDTEAWEEQVDKEESSKETLLKISDRYEDVVEFLNA
jgi:hypothetical protein